MSDTAPSSLREIMYNAIWKAVNKAQGPYNSNDAVRDSVRLLAAIRSALLEDPTRAEELGMEQVGWWRGREVHEHMPACDEAPNRCRPVFAIQSTEDD